MCCEYYLVSVVGLYKAFSATLVQIMVLNGNKNLFNSIQSTVMSSAPPSLVTMASLEPFAHLSTLVTHFHLKGVAESPSIQNLFYQSYNTNSMNFKELEFLLPLKMLVLKQNTSIHPSLSRSLMEIIDLSLLLEKQQLTISPPQLSHLALTRQLEILVNGDISSSQT